jgi:hypothetical protein
MAGENNNAGAPTGGDRGLQGQQPTIADQISTFKGMASEDGAIQSVQDGATPVVDPDAVAGEGEGDDGLLPPRVDPNAAPPAPAVAPKPKSAQERINEAVKKQRAAERALEAERSSNKTILDRLERLEKGGAPAPLTNANVSARSAADASAPDPSKYQYGDLDPRFIADVARHEAKVLLDADKAERENARRAEAQAQAKAQFDTALAKATVIGVAAYPDFQELVIDGAKDWDLSQTVGELAFESEVGPHILYHLATNADESKALAKQSPAKQAAWFGKMEAYFASKAPAPSAAAANGNAPRGAQPVARPTQAPPVPERRVRGGGNPNPVTPDTTDFSAFEQLASGGRQH